MNLQALRDALVAIANADAELQALTGRDHAILTTLEGVSLAEGPFPIVVYTLEGFDQTAASGDRRRGTIVLRAIAQGAGAYATCEQLLGRCAAVFSWSAFNGQGVDACPMVLHGPHALADALDQQHETVLLALEIDLQIALA